MLKDQENLLRLIKEIDAICKKHNITYYAAGGTVIGALRHKGFIPWDDDIDIYMTRDNWNKFRQCFDGSAPERRILECWESNKGYHNLLARYMDLDTTSIFKYQIYGDANMGQLIDIFVLDPIIGTEENIKAYEKNVMLTSDLIGDCISYSHRLPDAEEYMDYYKRIKREGKESVVNELYAKLEKFSEAESDTFMLRWGGMPHIFPKEMFAEPKYYDFEDMQMPLPSLVSDYLIQLYGLDWINIPALDGQITHNSISNNDYPFATFKELIVPRVKTKAEKKFLYKKQNTFKNLPFLHASENEVLKMEGDYVKNRVLNKIKAENIDVLKAINEKNLQLLSDLFSEYIEIQVSKQFVGNGVFAGYYKKLNPTFIDLGDDNFYAVLWYLTENGKIKAADRLLQIREAEVSRPLSSLLSDFKDMLNGIKKAANHYEFKRFEEAESIINSLLEKTQNNQLYKFKLFLWQRLNEKNFATKEYLEFAENAIVAYPEDADFLKLKADYLWNNQNKSEALELYTKVLSNSRNGIILLHIKEQLKDYIEDICEYIRQASDNWQDTMSLWFDCFGYNEKLLRFYIDFSQENGGNMLNILCDNHIQNMCKDPDILPNVLKILSQLTAWKKENIYVEILNEILKTPHLIKENLLDDQSDISRYQLGIYYQNMGENKKAYKIFMKLSNTDNAYVKQRILIKLKRDLTRYLKQAKNAKASIMQIDFKTRYDNMDINSYIKLLEDFEVISEMPLSNEN